MVRDTSAQAWYSVDPPVKAQDLLLLALFHVGPASAANAQARFCPDYRGNLWKRSSEVVRDGYAEETGDTELNESGRSAIVLRITPKGKRRLQDRELI